MPLCQTCSDALRDRVGSWSCPDPNVCGNQNDPFPPDDWQADDWPHVPVLPTPAACNPNDGEGPETWLRRREEGFAMGSAGAARHVEAGNRSLTEMLGVYERWGKYAPAIHRWEQATRPAPAPTEPNSNNKPRLAAAFAEWMMGLPECHVTNPEIGISRADQLKAIGNGVCPQQAYAAIRELLAMTITETLRR